MILQACEHFMILKIQTMHDTMGFILLYSSHIFHHCVTPTFYTVPLVGGKLLRLKLLPFFCRCQAGLADEPP